MPRSPYRNLLAEAAAVLGIAFGVWLTHNAFQAGADLPALPAVALGALDILLCFFLLGYFLRQHLRGGDALPKRWIAGGGILVAGFLGWIAALFLDSERLLAEEQHHREYSQQLAKLDQGLRHMGDAMGNAVILDRHAWDVNHDLYARVHDQLQASLRARPLWIQELTRIDEQVRLMRKAYTALPVENIAQQRLKLQGDFQLASDRAEQISETLRTDIAKSEQDVVTHRRARWHGVGAAALTGVLCILGSLMLWLVFDRELRRSWRMRARLAESETRYRLLIENGAEPLALVDASSSIVYANPAWQPTFNHEPEHLFGTPLLGLVHPDDKGRILSALQSREALPISVRLRADYGVWHDVEMLVDAQTISHGEGGEALIVRFRKARALPEVKPAMPMETPVDSGSLQKLQEAEAQIAELERRCQSLRDQEQVARTDLDHQRWLFGSHRDAGSEGLLIVSAQGKVLSWNPAFAQMWKLSQETLSGHTWLTIAAHMETLAESGWADFHRAATRHESTQSDSCWEMTLEGGKLLEVYSQILRDHPGSVSAVRFHFRDVTRHRDLEIQVRDHDEHKRSTEADLREREKRLKHLEKQLQERDRRHEELEAALLEHQDRLHQMHQSHEDHAASLKTNRESMRRLASGVANEFNTVLSVILGNTDVLRDNLPKDHVAQNHLDDIHQAASRGTELSQRLIGFSRNHLLQMTPIEINEQLESLESKLRVALGHVQLRWERGAQELWAKADAHPLEQALLHLAANAKHDMPQGGTVTIRTGRAKLSRDDLKHADLSPGNYVRVELRDTGAGMDEETLAHVFDPYHPLRDGHKGDLSLATAYGTLRQCGGCIDAESLPGQGTTWTILLPETTERPQAMRASA